MENQNSSRILTWWFIPEEYCPIFLELEKQFNKQIDVRRQISELKKKIDDTPAFKRKSLKDRLTTLSEKRQHFSYERIEDFVESQRIKRHYHYSDLADNRLGNPTNKSGKKDKTFRKFVTYADIMGNKAITKVIVEHFLLYFKNLGILKDANGEYYIEHYSNHIANYKVPFVTAQIILDCITADLQSNRASRMIIFEAIHSLNQNPLVAIEIDNGKSREKALYDVYRKLMAGGLDILLKNGFIRESEQCNKQYEFVYGQEYESQQELNIEIRKERNKERRLAAFKELAEIHARFHQTTSTSKEKEKAKLKRAQEIISEKLSVIDQSTINDRIIYHWTNVIFQSRYYSDFRNFQTFANDILTYIRYQNIEHAVSPITNDSLYQWESSYYIWDAISKVIQEEAKLRIVNWPTYISETEYQKSVNNILYVIDNLIGNDTIENLSSSNNLDNKTIRQIQIHNEQLLSLYFVRANVEPSSANEHSSHLKHLFKIITSENKKNYLDLCYIIKQLNLLALHNTFEYASKTKLWEYSLKKIPDEFEYFDVQTSLINIYIPLIGLSNNNETRKKYQKDCSSLFKRLNPQSYDQKIEVIILRDLYIRCNISHLSYQEIALLLLEQWNSIDEVILIANENDPRPYIYKYEALYHAATFLNRYFNFDYTLSILLSQAYIHLKELKIDNDLTYYNLLSMLGKLIKKIKPELAFRIANTNITTCYANWSHYRNIAENLLDSGDYKKALEYANKATEAYDCNNIGDIQGETLYLESLLTKVEILFGLGKEADAKSLYLECELKLKELEELYPQICLLDSVNEHLRKIKSSQERLVYRWMRLLSILMAIVEMDSLTPEVDAFFNKWKYFNGLEIDEDESNPKELIDEFKSDIFPLTMQAISKNVVFKSCDVEATPITQKDIKQLNKELLNLYKTNQLSFLCNEMEVEYSNHFTTVSEIPSNDMLFELLQPECSVKAFVSQMNIEHRRGCSDRFHFEDFEKYHYIVMSDCASTQDRINASDIFISKLDPSTKSIKKREMAAEVLCQMSSMVDFLDYDKQEKILNQAESYIVNKDGSIISSKATEIYLRIMHRLYDVYDYQEKSGLQESLMVEHALELIESNNIQTVDAAWFLGERAEHSLFNKNDKATAQNYFERAIAILQSIDPPTDDSQHFLALYQEFLA